MADNERDLGINITAKAVTSDAIARARQGLDELRRSTAQLNIDFNKLSEAQKVAALSQMGIDEAATRAAMSMGTATSAVQASTVAIQANTAAIREQSAAIAERDRLVAQAARAAVSTPMTFMPGSMTEGYRQPTAAALAYRAQRQVEAEELALARARASVVTSMSGAAFGAQLQRNMGMANAPLSAASSAQVFAAAFAEQELEAARAAEVAAKAAARLAAAQEKVVASGRMIASRSIREALDQQAVGASLVTKGYIAMAAAEEKAAAMARLAATSQEAANVQAQAWGFILGANQFAQDNPKAAMAGRFGSSIYGQRSVATDEMRHIIGLGDSLARGNRGQAISSLGAGLRDAGLSAEALVTSFGAFVVLVGGAAIITAAKDMGEWAENVKAGAAASGMSVSNFSQIQGAIELTGGKADAADTALRHFAQAVAVASSDAGSKAAKAFHAVGISQEELVKNQGDVSGMFNRTIDLMSQFENGAQKAGAEQELFGRGMEKLGGLASMSGQQLDDMKKKAEDLGITLNDKTADALTKVGNHVEELEKRGSGNFKKGMEDWLPVIDKTLTGLDYVADALGRIFSVEGKLQGQRLKLLEKVYEVPKQYFSTAAHDLGFGLDSGPTFNTVAKTDPIKSIFPNWEGADKSSPLSAMKGFEQTSKDLSVSMREGKSAMAVMIQEEKDRVAAVKQANAEIFNSWHTSMTGVKAILQELDRQDMATKFAQREQMRDIRQGGTNTDLLMGAGRASAGFTALAGGNAASGANEAMAESQTIIAEAKKEIAALEEVMNATNASRDVRVEAAQEIVRVVTEAETKTQELLKETGSVGKSSADIFANAWKQSFDKLDTSFEEFGQDVTKALLAPQQEYMKAGLTTIKVNLEGQQLRAAAQKIFLGLASDMVGSILGGLNQLAAKGIAKAVGTTLEPGQGLGALAGKALGIGGGGQAANFGITAGNLQAFNTALTQATATLTGHSTATTGATAAQTANAGAVTVGSTAHGVNAAATTANAGAQVGGAAATTINTAATSANTVATAADTSGFLAHLAAMVADEAAEIWHTIVTLLSLEGGGVVPSAAGGMIVGGGGAIGGARGGRMSILHPREMVLPAHLSEGVQNMIRMTGGHNSSNNSASLVYAPQISMPNRGMDRAQFGSMLRGSADEMIGMGRNLVRRGWRP